MNDTFDPITLLIIAGAVIVFFKLRGVLGQRTGHQKPFDLSPPKRDKESDQSDNKNENNDDNVIQLPTKSGRDQQTEATEQSTLGLPDDSHDEVVQYPQFADILKEIDVLDPSFDPAQFIEGAKAAYEMIVTSFANADKKTLGNLLSKDVFAGFSDAIDQRKKSGAEMSTQFIGIDDADIVNIELENRRAFMTVRFTSELVSVVRDRKDNVIEGDATEVQNIIDTWTFERDLASKDPNWRLVSTDGDEA